METLSDLLMTVWFGFPCVIGLVGATASDIVRHSKENIRENSNSNPATPRLGKPYGSDLPTTATMSTFRECFFG